MSSDPFATTLYGLTRANIAALLLRARADLTEILRRKSDSNSKYDALHALYVKAPNAERLALNEAMMMRLCHVDIDQHTD